MPGHSLIAAAAAPAVRIVRNIRIDQFQAPTPCSDYHVRTLLNHLLFWGPALEGAARKEQVPPPAAAEHEVDLVQGDWAAAYEAQVDQLVAAWGKPEAWSGTTFLGGPMELPASTVGGMAMGELVVHGWDLARATGQQPCWDDDVVGFLLDEVGRNAEQGRSYGVYGSPVAVPAGAPLLDRTVGLTGRDPGWTP
jgi:uncharacterized protein (TIGR03086 family)